MDLLIIVLLVLLLVGGGWGYRGGHVGWNPLGLIVVVLVVVLLLGLVAPIGYRRVLW